jgi:hypothetical protein
MKPWLLVVIGPWVAACSGSATAPELATVLLPSSSAASRPSALALARLPADWSGWYSAPHEVSHVCDNPDWCVQEVSDSLRLAQQGNDLQVEIELVQTNFHTCTWHGAMTSGPVEGRWEYSEPECALVLELKGNLFRLSSEGCREYCGARAYLSAEFAVASRSSRPPRAPAE